MKKFGWIFPLVAIVAAAGIVSVRASEPVPASPATNVPALPMVKMTDVPITSAIENLARQAGVNYMIDPALFPLFDAKGHPIPEPLMTFTLTNVTARETLDRVLAVRGLVMVDDPVCRVARITRLHQATNIVDASLLGMDTNNPAANLGEFVPLIQFEDAPLDVALENLIRESGLNVALAPEITSGDPLDPLPQVSLRWENLSVRQAIIALCQNYGLVIAKDPATGGLGIKPGGARKPHHLWHP